MEVNEKLNDYNWILNKLIESDLALEKANEIIEQQQKTIKGINEARINYMNFYHELVPRAKRYEQALKDIVEFNEFYSANIAKKALEAK